MHSRMGHTKYEKRRIRCSRLRMRASCSILNACHERIVHDHKNHAPFRCVRVCKIYLQFWVLTFTGCLLGRIKTYGDRTRQTTLTTRRVALLSSTKCRSSRAYGASTFNLRRSVAVCNGSTTPNNTNDNEVMTPMLLCVWKVCQCLVF